MLTDRDIERAHPEAFDYAFGNLPPDSQASFGRHLADCRYCRGVVEEYGELGAVIRTLPPHAEPSASLEDRTVAAMVAAMARQKAKPAAPPAGERVDDGATRPYPVPKLHRAAEPGIPDQPGSQRT